MVQEVYPYKFLEGSFFSSYLLDKSIDAVKRLVVRNPHRVLYCRLSYSMKTDADPIEFRPLQSVRCFLGEEKAVCVERNADLGKGFLHIFDPFDDVWIR